ncbi:DUF2970 domain-containing protein [Chitinibacter bivalviorum]|uniref:DUF2970 domain-containing protein n=1 Tax=Chitinibacter bivalviorum TaxID=2739434 RepID=A0A7H9BLV2_9NEIS|nr:DUF2970 domain-containing protein [Chitinibacter bivalviorum]QLG89268.1 DUF2970 domain-containing protein [Chitinibacter bivalviorum]
MLATIRTVLAAFFGVRSRQQAAKPISPVQLVIAGVLCAVALGLLVWLLVRYLVAQAGQ